MCLSVGVEGLKDTKIKTNFEIYNWCKCAVAISQEVRIRIILLTVVFQCNFLFWGPCNPQESSPPISPGHIVFV